MKELVPVGKEKSEEMYNEHGIGKQEDFAPLLEEDELWYKEGRLPDRFTKIRTLRKNKYYTRKWYICFMDEDIIPESKSYFTFEWLNHQWFPLFSYVIQEWDSAKFIEDALRSTYDDYHKNFKIRFQDKKSEKVKIEEMNVGDTIYIKMFY